ncbi:ATP-dependent DNA helicase pfh1-like [Mizuhopecten yessoensis]|uniref:ATP-dependent DNA helicase pfh1-like n=1 Tax=Mizuhopecten yessoensis TaxID=6573 RepID=UPI000B45ACEE|nr:ATP-dependent DNA helicase pfh1-like [Mizuhopecten yessoensis]
MSDKHLDVALWKILQEIIQKEDSKNVAVTATTGMASLHLGSNATTLHHWAGILDGRHSIEKLQELFDNDDSYSEAKKRIQITKCLIIDEISMLSAKIFNMVESVCRLVKKNNQAFGGIQVLVSGDFKQLPPVPNYRLGDEGKYCFESEIFQQTFHHHINLPKVMRQHEEDLIKAVNELCNGSPSAETLQLMKSLDRPLDPGDDHTEIVSFLEQTLMPAL